MSAVVERSFTIAGLDVTVHSRDEILDSTEAVSVLFLLHGRQGSAFGIAWVVQEIFQCLAMKRLQNAQTSASDLIVVTFDHRNHGTRLVDAKANNSWSKDDAHNDSHAIDMYAIQTGTSRDVSFLIDFLPPYLFSLGERTVKEWIVSGISLGGHSTWLTLRNDPRVRIGIPIISCADYLGLLALRAKQQGMQLEPPWLPESLVTFIKQHDPVYAPYDAEDASNPFQGKRILALSGGNDTLVPWSATSRFFEQLNVGKDGYKKAIVSPDVGHQCTKEMVKNLVDFVWQESLV